MGRVQKYALVQHSDTPARNIWVGVKTTLVGSDVFKIEYVVTGDVGGMKLPPLDILGRHDGLWRHTCFELFVALREGYAEFNFSPSRRHASYRFESYRNGMQPALDLPAPNIYVERSPSRFSLEAWVDFKPLANEEVTKIGISAVIEATDGTKSYWALAHAYGPPDFHNRDCFIATLPAPDA